ncbi:MAG: DUF58 domain-containing protein [Victivallales bacterium]|nr:DUF58 domain-containing protein [Victivallales bacterium]
MPPRESTHHLPLLTPELLTSLGRLELIARQAVAGMLQSGIHHSRRLGTGQEFAQYRRYAAGDDLRHVDWRLYARSDQLHCRMQNPDTAARLAIVLDTSASMGYQGLSSPCTKLHCACIVAACLGYLAERQGDVIALFTYGERTKNIISKNITQNELCNYLEKLTANGGAHATECLGEACDYIRERGVVVWLTDFLGEESTIESSLRALRTAGKACHAIQILDHDEAELSLQGARRFEDPEDTRQLTTDPALVRADYLVRMDSFLEDIRQACLRQSVPYARLTARDDLGRLLAKFLTS